MTKEQQECPYCQEGWFEDRWSDRVTFIQSLKQIATEDELKGAYDAVL